MSEPNIHMSSDDWNKLKHLVDLSAENASLKAEVERLRASSFVTAVPVEEYEKLKAEVEKLENEVASIGSEYIAETRHYNLLNNNLKAEVKRLTELVESNLNSSKVAMSKADTVLHERDRLKAEVERLKIYDYKNLSMRIEIDKLNAKINRLVKAGDKMVLCIDGDYNYQMPCVQAWNAAKEGKPSV